jgi:type IV secretion system protein VirB4
MPRDDALDLRTMTPDWYARETRLAHMLPYVGSAPAGGRMTP